MKKSESEHFKRRFKDKQAGCSLRLTSPATFLRPFSKFCLINEAAFATGHKISGIKKRRGKMRCL